MLPPSSAPPTEAPLPSILPGGVGPAPTESPDPADPKVMAANYRLLGILLGVVLTVLAATFLGRGPLFGVLFHH